MGLMTFNSDLLLNLEQRDECVSNGPAGVCSSLPPFSLEHY